VFGSPTEQCDRSVAMLKDSWVIGCYFFDARRLQLQRAMSGEAPEAIIRFPQDAYLLHEVHWTMSRLETYEGHQLQ
jgi:hypothetical protein